MTTNNKKPAVKKTTKKASTPRRAPQRKTKAKKNAVSTQKLAKNGVGNQLEVRCGISRGTAICWYLP